MEVGQTLGLYVGIRVEVGQALGNRLGCLVLVGLVVGTTGVGVGVTGVVTRVRYFACTQPVKPLVNVT